MLVRFAELQVHGVITASRPISPVDDPALVGHRIHPHHIGGVAERIALVDHLLDQREIGFIAFIDGKLAGGQVTPFDHPHFLHRAERLHEDGLDVPARGAGLQQVPIANVGAMKNGLSQVGSRGGIRGEGIRVGSETQRPGIPRPKLVIIGTRFGVVIDFGEHLSRHRPGIGAVRTRLLPIAVALDAADDADLRDHTLACTGILEDGRHLGVHGGLVRALDQVDVIFHRIPFAFPVRIMPLHKAVAPRIEHVVVVVRHQTIRRGCADGGVFPRIHRAHERPNRGKERRIPPFHG